MVGGVGKVELQASIELGNHSWDAGVAHHIEVRVTFVANLIGICDPLQMGTGRAHSGDCAQGVGDRWRLRHTFLDLMGLVAVRAFHMYLYGAGVTLGRVMQAQEILHPMGRHLGELPRDVLCSDVAVVTDQAVVFF
jgi:hypothetical protein